MSRPTAEERRRHYLEVGAELALEFNPAHRPSSLDALANVKVIDVADRAGVTKGALYHLWESQDDYRRDLFRYILELRDQEGRDHADRTIAEVYSDGATDIDITDLAVRIAESGYEAMRSDPRTLARFSFYNYANDERVNELLIAGTTGFEDYYQTYMTAAGRRLRAPFTMQHLVTSVNAYVIGSIMRYRITGDDDVDGIALYGRGFRALLMRFTEPVPPT